MKTQAIILLTLFGCASASAQRSFKISGTVKDVADGTVLTLVSHEGMEQTKLASATAADGRFSIEGTAKRPYLCSLTFSTHGAGDRMIRKAELRLMLDTEPVTISTDTTTLYADKAAKLIEQDVSIEGGQITREYNDFLSATRRLDWAADSAGYAEARAWFENNGDDEAIKDYKERESQARQALTACQNEYFKAHPQAYPTAAMLAQRIYKDFAYTEKDYDNMVELLKQNPDTAHVNFINRNLALAKQYAIGARYTDFEGKRTDNAMARLSAQMRKSQFTLVDFWASWCGPCRAAIPKVKKMFEKYAGKLCVVSVSVDEKEDAWRKAEKAEAMPWPQLLLTKEGMSVAANAYRIMSIPRLVLISPEGAILAATHDPAVIEKTLKENIK